MFFEDDEFSDKKIENQESSLLTVDNDDWTINNGDLEEYKNYDEEVVRVPEGVTDISPYAISFNSRITTIYIPKSVNYISMEAIVECENLTSVHIENEDVVFMEGALSDNISLQDVYIGGKKAKCIISKTEDKEEPCFDKYLGDDSEFIVPDGIKMINVRAFENCKSLESVYIPDSVTDISNGAFTNCINIRELKVPPYIEYMGGRIFWGWTENQTVYVPKTFKGIKFFQNWRKGCKAKVIYY